MSGCEKILENKAKLLQSTLLSENTAVLIARVLHCFQAIESSFHDFAEQHLHERGEIINCGGGKQDKIPLVNEDWLEQSGQFPVSLAITEEAEHAWGAKEGNEEEELEEEEEEGGNA
jgi:hypothetical protein